MEIDVIEEDPKELFPSVSTKKGSQRKLQFDAPNINFNRQLTAVREESESNAGSSI